MKFLRVLLNSLITGVFFSLLLSLLIADLNINARPGPEFYGRLTLFLTPLYGLTVAVVVFILYFIIEFLFGRSPRIKAISPSFLSLSFSAALLVFLLLFRLNYTFFHSFFSAFSLTQLRLQLIWGVVLAVLGWAVFWRYHRHRRRSIYFIIYFLIFFLGLGFMFWPRWRFPQPLSPSRLTILESMPAQRKATLLSLEGLSFDFLIPLMHEGKLPNFSWLMENGSWGRLETLAPTDPFLLYRSLISGKNPSGHRCLSPFEYRIWGKEPGLEALPRFMLFKQLARIGLLRIDPISPRPGGKTIWEIFAEMNLRISLHGPALAGQETEPLTPRAEKIFFNFFKEANTTDPRIQLVRQAISRDVRLEEKAFIDKTQSQPTVFALFLDGLNQVEIYFYKYSFPQLFGNIDHEELNRYSSVIEKYYQFYDQILGKYLANLKDDELLIVFSTHGMEPLPLWKRVVEWILGNPQVSGHYEFAPDGAIFFYGQAVARGQSLDKIKLVDIAPTLLYILGLPVARDMDGIVRSSVFRPDFSIENPIFYISSYDEVTIRSVGR